MKSQFDVLINFFKNKTNLPIPLIVILVGLGILNFVLLSVEGGRNAKYGAHTAELRVLSQRIAKNASDAASGNENAFLLLDEAKREFALRFNLLLKGDGGRSVFSVADLKPLAIVWQGLNTEVIKIVENEDTVIEFKEAATAFTLGVPQLQRSYDEVVKALVKNGAAPAQVSEAQKQIWRAERIVSGVNSILTGSADAMKAADKVNKDIARFEKINNALLSGNAALRISRVSDRKARSELSSVSKSFGGLKENIDAVLEGSEELFTVSNAATAIFVNSPNLMIAATNLNNKLVTKTAAGLFPSSLAGSVLFVVAVFLGGVYGFLNIGDAKKRREKVESENVHNQEAIMRLLDELGDFADGDLTVVATVTEDFTGAIADSINYSIDQMQELVSQINQSAVEVSSAAQETQATAMHLAEASEHQAQEIAGASAAVNEMAVSIDQVSANAAESSQVAQRSVEIANKGSEVVQNTIKGMDTIREQIQDTSKRIKRLGESSQEIGDIVSLINDIADQTNILALNAAIQASMAGDAGRGFAVVADEVQRLAERASAATKQIEALVKTIQTDTNEAVISMENTTTEVVKGARLAQDAGVSLEEIESVSTNLADLIQNISNAARQQAASAGHISNTMNVIQEITSQTSAGTSATAKSIGNLAELAAGMRSSVAGFKLPEQG